MGGVNTQQHYDVTLSCATQTRLYGDRTPRVLGPRRGVPAGRTFSCMHRATRGRLLLPLFVLSALFPYPLFWWVISFLLLFVGIGPLPPPEWNDWELAADFLAEWVDVLDQIRTLAQWLIESFLL